MRDCCLPHLIGLSGTELSRCLAHPLNKLFTLRMNFYIAADRFAAISQQLFQLFPIALLSYYTTLIFALLNLHYDIFQRQECRLKPLLEHLDDFLPRFSDSGRLQYYKLPKGLFLCVSHYCFQQNYAFYKFLLLEIILLILDN